MKICLSKVDGAVIEDVEVDEIEATEEVVRLIRGEELISEVPEAEFIAQHQGL